MVSNKRITISLISLFSVLAIGLGISYAYFSTKTLGNEGASNIDLKTADVELMFIDGPAVNLNDLAPGSTVTKTFRVENNNNSEYKYSVVWKSISNGFNNLNDLTYNISCIGYSDYEDKTVSSTTCPGLNTAYSPASSTTDVGIISETTIPSGDTQEYTVTFTISSSMPANTITSFGGVFGIVGGPVTVNHSFQ
jgi:hypothetical protein